MTYWRFGHLKLQNCKEIAKKTKNSSILHIQG